MSIQTTTVRNALRNPAEFSIRLECRGENRANLCNRSNKFWAAKALGNGVVEIHYGAIGTKGRKIRKDFAYFQKKVIEKMTKAHAPYVDVADPYGRRWA